MKRCFSVALILALLVTTVQAPALAEDIEIVSESIEAEVALADSAGETGLTVEDEGSEPERTPAQAKEESPVKDTPESALLLSEAVEDAAVLAEAVEAEAEAVVEAEEAVTEEDAPKAATSVKLSADSVTIGVKEKYSGLAAVAVPAGSALPTVTWRSSNKKVAKVNKKTGVITGVKRGTATIYAKYGNNKELKCKVTVKKAPKKVTLSTTSKTLSVGMDLQLTASVPRNYASGKLTFTSSKPKYATVDETGKVTALKKGTTTITVSTFNGKTAKCKVTVKKAPAAVAFPEETLTIAVDQKLTLKASGLTSKGKGTPSAITYAVDATSPDAGCVELVPGTSNKCSVTGLRKGTAIITATTQNGLIARCAISVDVAPKSVSLNQTRYTLGVGESWDGLTATLTPPKGSATCANVVKWSTSNKKIAKVDADTGVITAVATGSCTVKVKTPNGKTAKCKITVKKAPTGVKVSPENGSLKVGQTGKYKVTLSPSDCAERVSYASSDPKIADVDGEGYVTAIAAGKVTITVSTYNNKSKTVNLQILPDDTDEDDIEVGDDSGKTSATNAKKIEYIISVAQSQLGKPYIYGSGYSKDSSPSGFDCSGLMYWCFLQAGIKLKDTAYKQGYDESQKKISRNNLRRGDLVFFNTVDDSDLSDHSALYLGNGKFIHASSSARKVIISDMSRSGSYYDRVFSWGRRVLE